MLLKLGPMCTKQVEPFRRRIALVLQACKQRSSTNLSFISGGREMKDFFWTSDLESFSWFGLLWSGQLDVYKRAHLWSSQRTPPSRVRFQAFGSWNWIFFCCCCFLLLVMKRAFCFMLSLGICFASVTTVWNDRFCIGRMRLAVWLSTTKHENANATLVEVLRSDLWIRMLKVVVPYWY